MLGFMSMIMMVILMFNNRFDLLVLLFPLLLFLLLSSHASSCKRLQRHLRVERARAQRLICCQIEVLRGHLAIMKSVELVDLVLLEQIVQIGDTTHVMALDLVDFIYVDTNDFRHARVAALMMLILLVVVFKPVLVVMLVTNRFAVFLHTARTVVQAVHAFILFASPDIV